MLSSLINKARDSRPITPSSGCLWGWALALVVAGMMAPVAPLVPVTYAADADHLIVTEFMVKNRNPFSTFGSPFIEVTNPTGSPIDMSDVYITDATTSPSAFYYNITLAEPGNSNPGGGNGGDFHAKFPAGFSLGAGEAVVISLNGSTEYLTAYGRLPDFELFEDSPIPDIVPEMVEAFPGSVNAGPLGGNNVPVLSDVAESIVLYVWDGASDGVADLDYVMWGSNQSVRIDKTGVTIGSHTYLSDTAVASQEPVASAGPTFGHTFQRVSADEGTEVLTGGNGVGGHDETSENLATTWADVTHGGHSTGLAVAFPSAPIVSELGNGAAYGGLDVTVTATVSTFGTMAGVEFYYSVDGGGYASVSGSDAGSGNWSGTIPAQAEGSVVSFYCEAVNADGGQAVYPVAAPVFGTASYTVVAPPDPATLPEKLLITEVSTGPNIYPFTGMEQLAAEFIEIHNPNDYEVDLSDYYLTDAINYNYSTQQYWYIAEGNPSQSTVGGGHYNDFIARFPDDYMLAAKGTITISMAGSSWFNAQFGQMPSLEMYEEGAEADAIPDMRPVFENPGDDLPGNSIFTADRPTTSGDGLPRGIPELEEHYGEPLILFHYAEGNDLVTDIDIFVWGEAKTGNFRYGFDKTGEEQGDSAYEDDTSIDLQDWYMPMDESGTVSYTRVDAEEGTQTQAVGNGVDGRDETSENWNTTFETVDFTPGVFLAGGVSSGESMVKLTVPAKTFVPTMGESFPIEVVATDGSEARVRIFDREGRMVVSLFNGEASPIPEFPTRLIWDGRNSNYEQVPAGLYMIHLAVVNLESGEEETQTVPVVVATRLSK